MPNFPFKQVDVFTHMPFQGNPVAVVFDADNLTSDQMQSIARWTNLSETTFVSRASHPDADYHVRIFTPGNELPFAGHPTIGTAFALLEAGRVAANQGRLIQECRAGLIELSVSTNKDQSVERIEFVLPAAHITELSVDQRQSLESVLGCSCVQTQPVAIVDVGPKWIVGEVADFDALLAITPDFAQLACFEQGLGVTGVTLFARYMEGSACDFEVRTFAPSCGVNEDPVCGSGNGAVAAYLQQCLSIDEDRFSSAQGQSVGRAGRISLSISPDQIKVGGGAVTVVKGEITV
ncbi:PhzF family phenazine biosynthesis protein [Maribrevibacterium harenarium]|uniref:PhzF family phenazine biosynthesis protein n=1 Tax=Maribrevibacterium harenarium TaxID=2589817 RepID=A0A501WJE3_9GAMM|nr:PhzF family phenazine biosynthesis protein [Maribrevibacterium harenarium]TPE49478.1 PhzF family phenazine biosynthesis protein [Maribrevibacterium harenarium]